MDTNARNDLQKLVNQVASARDQLRKAPVSQVRGWLNKLDTLAAAIAHMLGEDELLNTAQHIVDTMARNDNIETLDGVEMIIENLSEVV